MFGQSAIEWMLWSAMMIITTTSTFILSGCEKAVLRNYPFEKGSVLLTSPPLDLNGVIWFFPMGGLNVLPKGHGGFILKDPYIFPASIPVMAVADGVVTRVSNGEREVPPIPDAPQAVWYRKYSDHLIVLKVSETMMINYGHVSELSSDFRSKLPKRFPQSEEGRKVAIEVEAGDVLGYVGPHGAMDFSITDLELDLSFRNPGRYPKYHIYSGNIFDYFEIGISEEMKQYAFRKELPRGGKIDYDVEGKIIGNWFLEGTTAYTQWSRQLAIAYHDLFGDRITISDGSPMRDVPGIEGPGAPDVWWVKGNAPAPETIGVDDGIIRYELIHTRDHRDTGEFNDDLRQIQGIMLVQALEGNRILVETFKGSTTASVFTSSARVYVR